MAEGKKRYVIVRVDDNFLNTVAELQKLEEIELQQKIKIEYGDTREQFINKLSTGIEIAINEYEKGNIPKGKENRRCAEIIAGYLGVK